MRPGTSHCHAVAAVRVVMMIVPLRTDGHGDHHVEGTASPFAQGRDGAQRTGRERQMIPDRLLDGAGFALEILQECAFLARPLHFDEHVVVVCDHLRICRRRVLLAEEHGGWMERAMKEREESPQCAMSSERRDGIKFGSWKSSWKEEVKEGGAMDTRAPNS